ncbi:hypothetical protein RYX36_031057 [Vicia faba]
MSSPKGLSLSGLSSAASLDPLIGMQVYTRWSPGGPFIEGDIIQYDSAKDMYKVAYNANTPNEFCDWIDMKEILPPNVEWEGINHIGVPSTVEQNGQDSDNDNAEKVKISTKKSTMCSRSQGYRKTQK